ncbi:hypothetical protein WE676_004965 [Escherichia coli O180:H48]|nr:hypothetical protein [Escherichia coli]HDP9285900.1 hypothetical protein [Escherichia coli]HDQ0436027.1 hypothetical protein [Escherichia coli]HDQ1144485.1 hypothetical protein [Escherichia coli]HDQ1295530.1 hypothetical protein [Escherichia coli]
METVFDALKAMRKATSVQLAARLGISREEVLSEQNRHTLKSLKQMQNVR